MQKKEYMPYNFDFKFQFRTYKNIGRKHKIQFKSEKNVFYRWYAFLRDWHNKKERKYKDFDKFSQWRCYIEKEFKSNKYNNNDDLKHYLQVKADTNEDLSNVISAIVTPIYVCLITIATACLRLDQSLLLQMFIYLSILLVAILVFLLVCHRKYRNRYIFYTDIIKILNND